MVTTKNPPWLMPVLMIFLALLLRLPNLNNSFYANESFSVFYDSNYLLTPTEDRFRPVFFTLLYLWRTIGFDGEVGLRLLPLIFGILSVPLAWTVGHRLGGRRFALGLSLLLATSPIHIEYSQELRMYALIVFLSFAQLACYLHYRERGGFLPLLLGTFVGLVAMYTHLFYAFCLMGFALLALLDRRTLRYKPFLASLIVVGLLYLPNLGNVLYFYNFHRTCIGQYAAYLPRELTKSMAAFSVGFNLFSLTELSQGLRMGWQVIWQNLHYVLPCLLVFGLLVAGAIRWITISGHRFARILILSLLIFPVIATSLLVLITRENSIKVGYLIFLLPSVLLFFAWGFQGLRQRPLQIAVGVLYSLLIGLALFHFYADSQHYGRRSNWRGVTEYLKEHLDKEVPVIVLSGPNQFVRYYGFEILPYMISAHTPGDPDRIADYALYLRGKLAYAREAYYLWIDVTRMFADPKNTVLKALRTIGTDEKCIQYNPGLKLYWWKLAEDGTKNAN